MWCISFPKKKKSKQTANPGNQPEVSGRTPSLQLSARLGLGQVGVLSGAAGAARGTALLGAALGLCGRRAGAARVARAGRREGWVHLF